MSEPAKTITIQVEAAEIDGLISALDFAAEGMAHVYADPTPEEEADYDDTDRALRADYLGLIRLAELLAAARTAHKDSGR